MNLTQAYLAGTVVGPLRVIQLMNGSESVTTSDGSVVVGSIEFFSQFFFETTFEVRILRRVVWDTQIAFLARNLNQQDSTYKAAYLGLTPSRIWTSSKLLHKVEKVVFLDDGASSLTADFASLTNEVRKPSKYRFKDFVNRQLAGFSNAQLANCTSYTCFPVTSDSVRIEKHKYFELVKALDGIEFGGDLTGVKTVYVDSNYQNLGDATHLEMVKTVHDRYGFELYIPHRRLKQNFNAKVRDCLAVRVSRPTVPIEIMIKHWTSRGINVVSAPSSIAYTGQYFVQGPGKLTILEIQDWIRERTVRSDVREMQSLAEALNAAVILETSIPLSVVTSKL